MQIVKTNLLSNQLNIVFQGSTLGSLLFSLDLNNLPYATNFHTRLCTNNTALFMFGKNLNLNQKANNELNNIDSWPKTGLEVDAVKKQRRIDSLHKKQRLK